MSRSPIEPKYWNKRTPRQQQPLTVGEHVEAMQDAGKFEDRDEDLAKVLRVLVDALPLPAKARLAQELYLTEDQEDA